jgi:hypothetical protein
MKPPRQLPANHVERLTHVMDPSWLILKSRYLQGRHDIPLEAPFQHYFARMLNLLEEAADSLQIVILTCHPERYQGLEAANLIQLGGES